MRKYIFAAAGFFVGLILASCFGGSTARATSNPDNQTKSVGPGVRFICQTSAPPPVGRARLWVLCSDGLLRFTSADNVDHLVSTTP